MSRWYRAYEGTVTDAKLAEAAMVAEVKRAVSIAAWHCLLESAASVNNCGSYDTTPRRVSIILCEPPAEVEALFAAYAELGLIGDGVILSWKKRQHESDRSAKRTQEYRERKRQETANNDDGDADVTSHDRHVTQSDALRTETETEEDKRVSNETLVDEPENEIEEEGLALKPEHLQEAWNAGPVRKGAVECKLLRGKRRSRAITFLKKWKVEDITEAIAAVARSAFLCGQTREGFRADISFLFAEEHMNRLLEGFYAR